MDSLHSQADLADLLRLIRRAAADSGANEEFWKTLETFVTENWFVLKFARAVIEEGRGRNEGLRDSINSLIVVASFISGVQGQMIANTYRLNGTSLQIATNFFLFVGMTLDVIGAATGVLSAILVRQYIERSRSLLMHINEIHRRIYEIIKAADHHSKPREHKEHIKNLERMCHQIRDVLEAHAWFSAYDEELESANDTPNKFRTIPGMRYFRSTKGPPLPYFSLVPVIAISLGTLCLLASVLTFAASSQFRWIWMTSVILTVLALLIMLFLWAIRKAIKNKKANYKSLESSLRSQLRFPLHLEYE